MILADPAFDDINAMGKDGRTVLHVASERGLVDICKTILSRPTFTEVNAINTDGRPALHFAAMRDLESVCLEILGRPDFHVVNQQDKDGRTVLPTHTTQHRKARLKMAEFVDGINR